MFCCHWGECSIDGFSVLLVYSVKSCILLICHLLVIESGVLKSLTVIVEMSIFLQFKLLLLQVFFVMCIFVLNCYIFLMNWPFCHYSMFFFVPKYILFNISIATSILFWLLFVWCIFLHRFSFILFLS